MEKRRVNSLMPTLRLENLADISTECFIMVKTSARFSNLKVGMKELYFFHLCRSQLRSNHFELHAGLPVLLLVFLSMPTESNVSVTAVLLQFIPLYPAVH